MFEVFYSKSLQDRYGWREKLKFDLDELYEASHEDNQEKMSEAAPAAAPPAADPEKEEEGGEDVEAEAQVDFKPLIEVCAPLSFAVFWGYGLLVAQICKLVVRAHQPAARNGPSCPYNICPSGVFEL